ncbi:MAG: hypothetical protein D6687_06330 [Acidobacteria bacterium]|jgi:hypothetical protein|nr:MAG: hypothetical protein D6687_06330 [Acidobacteriota bacterium]GIU82591.1 MAG: hypothetical protein KatS3mg006_1655 [Pyrinomonadaceae bacterium]
MINQYPKEIKPQVTINLKKQGLGYYQQPYTTLKLIYKYHHDGSLQSPDTEEYKKTLPKLESVFKKYSGH